jgi:hypothetical protein
LHQPHTASTGEEEAEVVAEGDEQLLNDVAAVGEEGGCQHDEQQKVEVPVGEEA